MKILNVGILLLVVGCTSPKEQRRQTTNSTFERGSFGYDVAILKKDKNVIVLGGQNASAKILLVPAFQGRIMTSTATGDNGTSFGWINYDLIQSKEIPPHMYPVGGEDRFWLGPEGGQYSIFFKKGPFDFEHWQTPTAIDTEPFDVLSSDSTQVEFGKYIALTNYSGFTFQINVNRKIHLLSISELETELAVSTKGLDVVGFESVNSISNVGKAAWNKNTGLLSIWILGMLNPTYETTVIIPYKNTPEWTTLVHDNYFGSIPSDRIAKSEGHLLLKADGKSRGKVGIAPGIAHDIVGSYDSKRHILTLVKFTLEPSAPCVNSKWEMQQDPYSGDAVNAYNDGPLENGTQMGPFYELESSSSAKALKSGEMLTHRHITIHLMGDTTRLNTIAEKTLGLSLKTISASFLPGN